MMLKVLAFLLIIPGTLMVYTSAWLVKRFQLDKKARVEFEHEMTEEELSQHLFEKASIRLKIIGLTIAIPGILLIFYIFR